MFNFKHKASFDYSNVVDEYGQVVPAFMSWALFEGNVLGRLEVKRLFINSERRETSLEAYERACRESNARSVHGESFDLDFDVYLPGEEKPEGSKRLF